MCEENCKLEGSFSWNLMELNNQETVLPETFETRYNALLQQYHIVESLIDSTNTMICVVNRNFEFVVFNTAMVTWYNKEKQSVIGKKIFTVLPLWKQQGFENHIMLALNGQQVRVKPSVDDENSSKFFETFFLPLKNPMGEVDGVIIKIHDRTEDMETERKLTDINKQLVERNNDLQKQSRFIEKLFDATIDVIAVFDADLRYISINQRGIERYGLSKEMIIGKKLLELFPVIKESQMYADLQKALKGEFVYDLSYTSSVLQHTNFENYYVPLMDDNEGVYAVMAIGHDITDLVLAGDKLKIANEILEEKNTELERSNEELEQFAYVASHDLQEPIRKIATYANKLLTRSNDTFSEETVTYLKRINNSTGRMYELINGLLLYSRITRHNNLFVKTPLDVVLKEVLTDFELKIQERKVAIQFSKLPEIEAVHVQMVQMFTNLIGNSFKFARKDAPPVIQIAAADLTDEQKQFYRLNTSARYLNIFYVDNGIGFDQKYADRIFDLFQRLHDRHQYEGSGLGLSICKKIVANHHGQIFAFSEEGKGATFQIILPYSQKQFIAD
jgi:PAS domain S-box-containing protein